jgi:hypothetical protein
MARATWILAATSVVATSATIWLYLDNRDLRARLDHAPVAESSSATTQPTTAARTADPWTEPTRTTTGTPRVGTGPVPELPEKTEESRLERRQRRQAEFAAMFGRLDGETDEDYRNRIGPMITTGLFIPRQRVDELRKQVEEKAGVTPEQSKKLDQTFDKIYDDAIDYTNKAIADGILSPYERNVSGWLEFAGGLGGILGDANTQIGKVLSPQQMKTIGASGFEWGEYLGAKAPWEKLNPPPPPK